MKSRRSVIDSPGRRAQTGRHAHHRQHTGPTLVIGGTGKTGRRVAARLQALGRPVRIGSRSGDAAFDWERPATWAPALRGDERRVHRLLPRPRRARAAELIAELAATALREGAGRLVLLSGRGEVEAQRAEAALAASGAEWTVVRCSWFMQNFSEELLARAAARAASSRCPPATCRCRSSTPTTSPTSRSRR